MDFQTERKIEVNRWIIKSRWFYMIGILTIGVLTKTISNSNVHFSILEMILIVFAFIGFNLTFYLVLRKIENQKKTVGSVNSVLLGSLGYFQLAIELVTFTFVMHKAGGVESISSVFFFLPIVSASLIFGLHGAIITALVAGVMVNALVVSEYLNFVPHIPRYNSTTLEFTNLPIALTKTVTTSIFYVIIGIFSGYGSKLLFRRERMLQEQTDKLNQESGLRNDQLKLLDQAKKKAEEEKNKSLAIILNFSDPIIVLDKENRITLFNTAARLALGIKNEDAGREVPIKKDFGLDNFEGIIRKKFTFKKIRADINSAGAEPNSVSAEKNKDLLTEELYIDELGTEATYKVITVNIKDDKGNYTGVMKIFYDFTREKIIDKMKSDFISIAAHQLRTPLSAIKWSTGMLLNGDAGSLNIEQENLLRKSYVSNEVMINLVNDLLNVSRIEEGRFGYVFRNITIQEILDTVIENSSQQIEKSGISLKIDNSEKHVQLCIDKEKMILALQNLIDNAIKYTPRYGTIEILVKRPVNDCISISVKDSGVGIPKEEREKLFSKFFRASNVVLMETEGTGLGLFIVKNIIEKHGGEVSIASEENKGTEVTIKLPIECKV